MPCGTFYPVRSDGLSVSWRFTRFDMVDYSMDPQAHASQTVQERDPISPMQTSLRSLGRTHRRLQATTY